MKMRVGCILSSAAVTSFAAYNVTAQSLSDRNKSRAFTLNIPRETELLKQCIQIAMEKSSENEWIDYESGNEAVTVQYKYLSNDSITTIRGFQSMDDVLIESDDAINDYYAFCDGQFDDALKWEMILDELCIEKYAVKRIDSDHNIIYSSHRSGVFGVSPRDFCYVKSRHLIRDYVDGDGNRLDMVCSLCYSLDDYVEDKGDYVRGRLQNCGYIFMKNRESGEVRACYVLHLDPGGWLPVWVINIVAPKKGMVVNKMHDNYGGINLLRHPILVNF